MQYDDTQYGADPYGYPPARSGRRGMLALGAAAVGVAAFAGVIVFAYSRGQHSVHNGAPPLLEADAAPVKSRPQDPGGYEVPHQDKMVYERLNAATPAKPGLERLLPPPEQPLPRPVVSPQVPPLQPAPVVAVAEVPAPQPPASTPQPLAPAAAPPAVVAPAPPASALAPAPPAAGQSSQLAALPAAPAKPKPASPKPTAPAAVPAAPATPPATAPAAGGKPAGHNAQPPVAAAALPPPAQPRQAPAPAKTVPAALTPPPVSAAAAPAPGTLVPPSARPGGGSAGRGGWRVQLASVPSEAQAQGEWKRLSSRHGDVLGGLGVNFAQATINGSTYYRVQAGVVDETRARSICAALKAQSVGCILVAP